MFVIDSEQPAYVIVEPQTSTYIKKEPLAFDDKWINKPADRRPYFDVNNFDIGVMDFNTKPKAHLID